MQNHHARWLLPAILFLVAASAAAQGASDLRASRPAADPLDAAAKHAPLVYQSSLATYKQRGENPPLPWREANDRVGRIGGWRVYAREASAPEPPAGPTPAINPAITPTPAPAAGAASAPMPRPGPHSGHTLH